MDINNIPGIGTKKQTYLNEKGINSVNDLILFYPQNYDVYQNELNHEQPFCIKVTIKSKLFTKSVNNVSLTFLTVTYQGEDYKCQSFALKYAYKTFKQNDECYLYGHFNNDILMVSKLSKEENLIIPRYSKVKGFSNQALQSLIIKAFNYGDCQNLDKLYNLHDPKSVEELNDSLFTLKVVEYRAYMQKINDEIAIRKLRKNDFFKHSNENIIKRLNDSEYQLHDYQVESFKKLMCELDRDAVSDVLLYGEVASGKTMLMLMSALKFDMPNQKVVIMAPSKILARQIYEFFSKFYQDQVMLITSNVLKKHIKQVEDENTRVIIGTQVLASDRLPLDKIALFMIDEQQKFGLSTKQRLRNKVIHANLIEVSATPIPHSLSQYLHGIKTVVKLKHPRDNITSEIIYDRDLEQTIRQAPKPLVIVCPLVKESESNLYSVQAIDKLLKKDYKTISLHGQMSDNLIDKNICLIKDGEVEVIITTSIFEVGMDFGYLNNMVILNAERFGLAQLHQMRGRIGRTNQPATCYLHVATMSSLPRIEFLKETNDGEKLASYDFHNRGGGMLHGLNQTGSEDFKLFDPTVDFDVIGHVINHI